MIVTFTRTGERRYRVSVEGPGLIASWMEPAPGYDPQLPHDMAHFVVENELGIRGGVFGQLASGGTAGTFQPVDHSKRRKILKRSKKISSSERGDALLSEKAVAIACGRWRREALAPPPGSTLSEEQVERICRRFDEVSRAWSSLKVGESMTLLWTVSSEKKIPVIS